MATQIVVPELGESVLEATVGRWLKREGQRVEVGEALVELETDKVNLEVGASKAGVLAKIERKEGEDVRIGDILGTVDETAAPPGDGRKAAAPEAAPMPPIATARAVPATPPGPERAPAAAPAERATPVAKRVAEAEGMDLRQVQGTGPGGRVTRADVERSMEAAPAQGEPEIRPSPEALVVPRGQGATEGRVEERVRMSRRRRTIARRLVEAHQTAAMLTTFNEIDMGAVMALRKRHNEAFQARHGVKLGITSFFVKACVAALKAFPRLNAELDGEEVVLKGYYDIGVAVGAEEGLVVPVLRDADRMTMADIERQIKAFSQAADQGKLALEDLRGGTFTLTNGGVFGSLMSTPILNFPQVGILGLHRVEDRPVVRQGEVVVRPMMYVALSYDHRVMDGREAVLFLGHVKDLVEDPGAMLLEV